METLRGAFNFVHPVEVRFADVDVGGHAHHSKVLIYAEEARAAYWREVAGRRGIDEIDFILADAEVRYHERILYPDRLAVGVRVPRMGRKHFVMEYGVDSPERGRLASVRTLQVMYDYSAGRSMPLADGLRARIAAHEGIATEGGEG